MHRVNGMWEGVRQHCKMHVDRQRCCSWAAGQASRRAESARPCMQCTVLSCMVYISNRLVVRTHDHRGRQAMRRGYRKPTCRYVGNVRWALKRADVMLWGERNALLLGD